MAEAAIAPGHEHMSLTVHSPRLTVASGLIAARPAAQLDFVGRLRALGPAGEQRGHDHRMLRAVANPHTDVLGHCTGRLVIGRRQRNGTQKPRPESSTPPARTPPASRPAGNGATEDGARIVGNEL
jgi:putative hydrolase